MEFRVLGPLEVVDDAGDVVPLPSLRVRTLLAILLMRSGTIVTMDELAEQLWEHATPPADRRASVHTYVGRLRAAVGADLVQTRPPGYQLDERPADLVAFRRLKDESIQTVDPLQTVDLLTRALDLWRGDPFGGISVTSLQREEAAGLNEERLHAIELLMQARLKLGESAELVGTLTTLTKQHPHRERLWAQRMLALYRADRQSEALDVYTELARWLAHELGIDPSPELQRLRQLILTADRSLIPATGSVPDVWVPRAQLPLDIRDFVGRAAHLEYLERQVLADGVPIVAISGTPGVGKTALAIKLAHRVRHRFPDGQWYVRLGGASDSPRPAGDLLVEMLRLAGLDSPAVPDDIGARSAALRDRLVDRRVLILLDDARTVDQVRPLLPGSDGCAVLVTSRQDLVGLAALDGAHRLALDVLDPTDATALLERMVGGAALRADPPALEALVRLCDRLPLALRIAGANIAARPRASLAEHVADLQTGDRLDKLRIPGDPRAAVGLAFELSYRSLPADAQRGFRLLGLVPGEDFTLPAAAALFGVDLDGAREVLDVLSAANLAQRRTLARYHLHDLLRLYAEDVVSDTGEAPDALRRLYDWYLLSSVEATAFEYPVLTGLPQPPVPARQFSGPAQAVAWLESERANLVAAVESACANGRGEFAWQLVDVLRHYLLQSGLHHDWSTVLSAGLEAAQTAGNKVAEGLMWQSLSNLADSLGDFEPALDCAASALTLFQESGFARGEASITNNMAISYLGLGQLLEAERLLTRSRELFEHGPDSRLATLVLTNLSATQRSLGDLYGAVESATTGLEIDHELSRPVGICAKLTNRADTYRLLGEYDLALADLHAALEISTESARGFFLTSNHSILAETYLDLGETVAGRTHADATLKMAETGGDLVHQAFAWRLLGDGSLCSGQLAEAARCYRLTAAIAVSHNFRYLLAEAQLGLAAVRLNEGALPEAHHTATQVLDDARSLSMRIIEARAAGLLAQICAAQGDPAATRHHQLVADKIIAETGYQPPKRELHQPG
ncbi:AfsR/SARP family transcriptional regulator [Kribbella catacumbae]|uniref:AfsR/SARP family transcriptional regulator n=1 Tax=Kribbella catacumbae TaxID=460086 RepID=UPI000362401A|nr:AfsR/SARP family transcriptional regulator [Kribbella catacumbae]